MASVSPPLRFGVKRGGQRFRFPVTAALWHRGRVLDPGAEIDLWGVSALRDAAWLTPDRARAWCRVLAALSLLGIAAALLTAQGGLDRQGKPLGTDFVSFYAAARVAATENAAAAYDPALHAHAQQALFPQTHYGYTTFLYPPPFLALCLPLAALPYMIALAAWLAAGLAALAAAMRPLLPPGGWLPLLAFPALLVNAGHGQNAMLTAACFAGYMALADRMPLLAGAVLGGLVIKPQLAMAIPLILLCARRWRGLLGAGVSAAMLCAGATLVLGADAWRAFVAAAPAGGPMLAQGLNGFAKMPTVFAGIRLIGGSVGVATVAQTAVAVGVLAAAGALAARRPGAAAEGALMAAAALLISPWCFDYDLVVLAPALAWVLARAATGFLPWEKVSLLAAYLLPLAVRGIATSTFLPLGPPVLLLLFFAVCRRAATA